VRQEATEETDNLEEDLPEPESHAMNQEEFEATIKEISGGDKFIYEPKGTLTIFNGVDYIQLDVNE
jgi:hypothetical protein